MVFCRLFLYGFRILFKKRPNNKQTCFCSFENWEVYYFFVTGYNDPKKINNSTHIQVKALKYVGMVFRNVSKEEKVEMKVSRVPVECLNRRSLIIPFTVPLKGNTNGIMIMLSEPL